MSRSTSRPAPALAASLVAMLAWSTAGAGAQEEIPRPLRLDDYYDQVRIGRIELAPDDAALLYERRHIDRSDDAWVDAIYQYDSAADERYLLVADARVPRYSPDSAFLGFLRDSQVWVLPSHGGEPWQVTDTPEPVSEFAWAPDSTRIVIVTRDPRAPAPPIVPLRPQPEEEPVPAGPPLVGPGELDAGDWEPAEGAPEDPQPELDLQNSQGPIAVDEVWLQPGAAPPPPDRLLPRIITRLQFKADGEGYVGTRRSHLYVVTVESTGRARSGARRVTSGPWDDSAPAWSPDGRWIAFTSNRTAEPDVNDNRDLWVVSPTGGAAIRLTAAPGPESAAAWSPDSRHIAYLSTPAEPPVYAQPGAWLLSLAPDDPEAPSPVMLAGDPVELTGALDRPLVSPPRWNADGTGLLMTVQDRGTVPLVQISSGLEPMVQRERRRRRATTLPRGVPRVLVAGPRVVGSFALLPDGSRVVAAIGWGTRPFEIFSVAARPQAVAFPMQEPSAHVQPAAVRPDAALRQLTDENGTWRGRVVLSEPEPLRYTSPDGTPIEGWLLRPPETPEQTRLPLVVRLHGGPVTQYTWALAWEHQWLAAQGYAVLYVNPRGSSGYGLEFASALFADWGGPDGADVLAGVDHVLDRAVADPSRIGIGGWSYGGLLTNLLITSSDRFAAAVSGASEADYFACYGTDDLQQWWESELGLPYDPETRRRYREMSPIERVDRIETPTLFLTGELDWRVPAAQSEHFYTQLRRRALEGGPPTRLILYPEQSHGDFPPSLSLDVLRRYGAWYDRYLKGDPMADPFFGKDAW